MAEETSPHRCGMWTTVACAAPFALPILFALIYAVAPGFYLRYILEFNRREFQAVELLTALSALAASILLLAAGMRAWRFGAKLAGDSHPEPRPPLLHGRRGAVIIFIMAAGSFFLAGEEISWGQTYFGWESDLRETNLHNTVPISFGGLGSAGIVALLVLLPIAWRFRTGQPRILMADCAPAIAEGPVIAAVATAFVISAVKSIAGALIEDKSNSTLYMEYFEQLKEQKEMLIAVALLLYGLYRGPAVRRWMQIEEGERSS